jgi:serine/threonine protein phosphatase 1
MLPNRIGVDTGAYETGVLTAVRLEDGRAEFMSVGTNIR